MGTLIGSIVSAGWSCLMNNISTVWHTFREQLFLHMAMKYDITEHTFERLSNPATIPRLLSEMGLRSYRHLWLHEANAETNDWIQHGTIRLPSRSLWLRMLALGHITHYLWISDDAQTVHIQGPTSAVMSLVYFSNSARTRALREDELHQLKSSFGMTDTMSTLDGQILLLEFKFYSGCILITGLCVSVYKMTACQFQPLLWCAYACMGLVIVAALYYTPMFCRMACLQGRRVWQRSRFFRWRRLNDPSMLSEEPFLQTSDEVHSAWPMNAIEMHSHEMTPNQAEASTAMEVTTPAASSAMEVYTCDFSLVVSHSHYYEVAQFVSVAPTAMDPVIMPDAPVKLYGMRLVPEFVKAVAQAAAMSTDFSLYVCVHNPCMDPPLTTVRTLLGQSRPIFLVVILPELGSFADTLSNGLVRTNNNSNTELVSTCADFQHLLIQMTTGIVPLLAFVFPVIDVHAVEQNIIWQLCLHHFGSQHCRRIFGASDRVG